MFGEGVGKFEGGERMLRQDRSIFQSVTILLFDTKLCSVHSVYSITLCFLICNWKMEGNVCVGRWEREGREKSLKVFRGGSRKVCGGRENIETGSFHFPICYDSTFRCKLVESRLAFRENHSFHLSPGQASEFPRW